MCGKNIWNTCWPRGCTWTKWITSYLPTAMTMVNMIVGKVYVQANWAFIKIGIGLFGVARQFFKNKIQEGKIVLIDFKQFIEKLYAFPDEYEMNFGRINYYSHPKQIGERFPSNDWSDSIFLKSRKYSYQKEFRVAINRSCGVLTEKRKIFRFFHDFDVITSYEPYEYHLPDIKSISKIFSATELEIGKDFFNLKIC